MNLERWSSLVSRVFFGGAFVLLALAVIEHGAGMLGYTIPVIRRFHSAGRLLDFAALALVFVIALQLREVREELRRARP